MSAARGRACWVRIVLITPMCLYVHVYRGSAYRRAGVACTTRMMATVPAASSTDRPALVTAVTTAVTTRTASATYQVAGSAGRRPYPSILLMSAFVNDQIQAAVARTISDH